MGLWRIQPPVGMDQGHPQSGQVEKISPSPHCGSHRGRENFSRSGGQVLGEAGRKRKRGDQAKLAPRRGFYPSPTGHQGSTNNWRLSKGVLRVARSLGVATASSPPSPG